MRLVILALGASYYLDMSAVKTLRSLHEDLAEKRVESKVAEATGLVRDKLRKGGLEELFGELGPSLDVNHVRRN